MSECSDKHLKSMLHAYELGMLTDEERRDFELHLLDCQACRDDISSFEKIVRTIREDDEVRKSIESIGTEDVDSVEEAVPGGQKQGRRRWIPTLVPATLAALIILFVFTLKPWQFEISPTQEAIAAQNRLAIMYFDNIADPDDSQRLGQILTNLLITDMAESRFIQVVSHQHLYDLLKFLDKEEVKRIDSETATQVAKKARARWMLMGNILQVNPHLVVTAQLVDVESGNIVASQQVTGGADETIFTIVDKLSAEIKSDLSLPPAALSEIDRPVAEVTTHSPDAYLLYLEGVNDYIRFYMDDAAEKFNKALEYDSTFAMAYYYLAIIGDKALIKKAVFFSENASHLEQQYIKSRAALIAGNSDDAIEIMTRLLERYPDEKLACFFISSHYYGLRRYDQSLFYLEKAIDIDPLYIAALNQMAYTYDALGQTDKSIEAINKYIAIEPEEANPYDTRGELLAKNGKLTEAIESYQTALEKRPDFQNSKRQLVYLYILNNEFDKAERLLGKLLELADSKEISSYRLSLAYIPQKQGKFRQTLKALDDGIDWMINHDNLGIEKQSAFHHLKAVSYSEMGDYTNALASMRKCVDLANARDTGKTADYFDLYVQLLAESGDFEKAEIFADSLKGISEYRMVNIMDYKYAMGTIALAKGNPEAAVAYLEDADSHAPAFSFSIHYMLGHAYLAANRFEKAAKEFESINQQVSVWRLYWGIWSVKSYYYLGLAYQQLHQEDKAAKSFRLFLDTWENADPGIDEIDDARARLTRLESKS